MTAPVLPAALPQAAAPLRAAALGISGSATGSADTATDSGASEAAFPEILGEFVDSEPTQSTPAQPGPKGGASASTPVDSAALAALISAFGTVLNRPTESGPPSTPPAEDLTELPLSAGENPDMAAGEDAPEAPAPDVTGLAQAAASTQIPLIPAPDSASATPAATLPETSNQEGETAGTADPMPALAPAQPTPLPPAGQTFNAAQPPARFAQDAQPQQEVSLLPVQPEQSVSSTPASLINQALDEAQSFEAALREAVAGDTEPESKIAAGTAKAPAGKPALSEPEGTAKAPAVKEAPAGQIELDGMGSADSEPSLETLTAQVEPPPSFQAEAAAHRIDVPATKPPLAESRPEDVGTGSSVPPAPVAEGAASEPLPQPESQSPKTSAPHKRKTETGITQAKPATAPADLPPVLAETPAAPVQAAPEAPHAIDTSTAPEASATTLPAGSSTNPQPDPQAVQPSQPRDPESARPGAQATALPAESWDKSADVAFRLHLKATAGEEAKAAPASGGDELPTASSPKGHPTTGAISKAALDQPAGGRSSENGRDTSGDKQDGADHASEAQVQDSEKGRAGSGRTQDFGSEVVGSAQAAPEAGTTHVVAPQASTPPQAASRAPEVAPPARTAPANPADSLPEPAKPAASAHDIKLQVNGVEHHVEVRLTQRDGDVHVAVRTPDARLAGELREDLPALAAKLEQTGFKAESSYVTSGDRNRVPDPAPANSQQGANDQQGQQGGNRQNEQQPRDQKHRQGDAEPSPEHKADGKEFAWMLTSIR